MIEIHSYRCDICGKCFDNREDCRKRIKWFSVTYVNVLCSKGIMTPPMVIPISCMVSGRLWK